MSDITVNGDGESAVDGDEAHEVGDAVYQRTAAGLEPRLFCSCGFVAVGMTWEEVGEEYDAHLAEDQ